MPLKSSAQVNDIMADESRDALVRADMEHLQLALSNYGQLHLNIYPNSLDRKFLKNVERIAPGSASTDGLLNPYTGKREWPESGTLTDIAQLRMAPPQIVAPGKIIYLRSPNNSEFALIGGARDGKALRDQFGNALVLSVLRKETGP